MSSNYFVGEVVSKNYYRGVLYSECPLLKAPLFIKSLHEDTTHHNTHLLARRSILN